MRLLLILILSILLGFYSSCSQHNKSKEAQEYISISKNDTAYLSLNISKNKFFGKYSIHNTSSSIQKGIIEGDAIGDTLLGSFYYTPYKTKTKKRKAIAFLLKNDSIVLGSGIEINYMGLPYYHISTVHFDNPKHIFKIVSK